MQKVQVIIYIVTILIVFVVVAVLFTGGGIRGKDPSYNLTMWGTFPENSIRDVLTPYNRENKNLKITYVEKNPEAYEEELINALATGTGPDVWVISEGMIHRHKDKIFPMPSMLMTEREFKETYTDVSTSIFFQDNTILGLPFSVDPLVLFWNKDFFASEALALPPSTWDEFITYTERLTKRDAGGNITRAGAGLGLTSNIPEAKDIVSLLILQGGTSIIDTGSPHDITLGETRLVNQIRLSPTESALRFYTVFTRRNKTSYTWNNTFSDPQTAFSREELAMFVGRASNLPVILNANSHINVGVSPVPQFAGASINITHGRTHAFTVSRASPYRNVAAWQALKAFNTALNQRAIAEKLWAAPARRDALRQNHSFPAFSVFYESTLRARTWYDPSPKDTATIFNTMINQTIAGRDISGNVSEAAKRLKDLLR